MIHTKSKRLGSGNLGGARLKTIIARVRQNLAQQTVGNVIFLLNKYLLSIMNAPLEDPVFVSLKCGSWTLSKLKETFSFCVCNLEMFETTIVIPCHFQLNEALRSQRLQNMGWNAPAQILCAFFTQFENVKCLPCCIGNSSFQSLHYVEFHKNFHFFFLPFAKLNQMHVSWSIKSSKITLSKWTKMTSHIPSILFHAKFSLKAKSKMMWHNWKLLFENIAN